jgi:long-chain acyl-CoA synthetase
MGFQEPITSDVVAGILASMPTRIGDLAKLGAERWPNQLALVETSGTWTYAQLLDAINETKERLLGLGVRPGDRVGLVCENCRSFVAILMALAEMDAWPVLVNAKLSAREVDEIWDHCGARCVIYTTNVSHAAREHAKRHEAVAQEVGRLGSVAIGAIDQNVEPEPLEPTAENRVAALIYTSGTTGVPKGVMLSHRNVLYIAAISARIRSLTPKDRLYGVLPMSHAVGLSVVLLGTLISGGTLYLSPRFDPVLALKSFEKDQITVLLGAPAMFALLLDYAKLKGISNLRFPALRIIASAGAPLDLALKQQVEKFFGLVLHNGYGVTETSPTIAQTRVEVPRTDISVGRVFPGVEVKLAASDGRDVAEGEVGELLVRGLTVMKGYYRAPEETAVAINGDGWFNTRDLARSDDGSLFIVGRTKDMIVHFGLNVYPAEVEGVLNAYPGVRRSAVIGRTVEGAEGGEEIVAVVQLAPEAHVTDEELMEHAGRHLAPYKRPTHVVFVPELPVGPTGKVQKSNLARMVQKRMEVG